MNHPTGRSEPLRRGLGIAVLALGVLGLSSCSDDLTSPADQPGSVLPTVVQQALVPGSLTEVKLTASDAGFNNLFGASVALSGETAVIGAFGDDDQGSRSGSAYMFERVDGAWIEEQKLTASDGVAFDQFGFSVAVAGDVAVIGAPTDDDHGSASGSAYVFERAGGAWVEAAKLTASDGGGGDQFGRSVTVSGETAVIGAWRDDDDATDSGSAYVFRRVGGSWVEAAKVTASDGVASANFGNSVALSGNVTVIGALRDDDNGVASGSAYVFELVGGAWVEVQKLTASDGEIVDLFGTSVSLNGDVAVIGAEGNDDDGTNSGSAYVFERAGGVWGETAKLTASDGAASDFFGTSVAVSDDVAMIGARLDDDHGVNSGSAYVFERTGGSWVQVEKLTASDGAAGDLFGISVAVSGDAAVIGAIFDDDNGTNSGSAYVFESSVSTLPVAVDIKPGSDDNSLSLRGSNKGRGRSSGTLPVAVLTTSTDDGDDVDFDATTVDPTTLTLGDDDGDDTPLADLRNGRARVSVEDVDDDADDDLLLHFDEAALVDNADLDENTTELVLHGETVDGTAITGADRVRIVGSP